MKLRSALLASAMITLPLAAANAEAISGLYMGGGAGINLMQQERITISPPATSGTVRPQIGPALVLSLGWGFGNGLRAEIEGSWRHNQGFRGLTGFGPGATLSGSEQKYGGMANVLYDFTMVPMVQPYVGVGLGYQVQQLNISGLKNDGKGSLAYQAILGAALPLSPALALTAEYRFMGLAGDRTFNASVGPATLKSTDNYNHSILLGVRYAFNAAPAAAPVMPMADLGAKTFLVFFDHNRSDLTSSAHGVIDGAAAYASGARYTRIDVDGNADTSGNPAYNVGLSERRARAVAAELVRKGIPQSAISMHAYGDTRLLVPTGPGVREPQNRRVEIVYR